MGDELKRRPPQCEYVHARVRVKAPILIAEQNVDEARIDLVDGYRQAPAAVLVGIGAQQPALAIEHDMRIVETIAARHRAERGHVECNACQPGDDRAGEDREAVPPVSHRGAISTDPVAVRPKRSGRYMSSTRACGSTYLPGETARTT